MTLDLLPIGAWPKGAHPYHRAPLMHFDGGDLDGTKLIALATTALRSVASDCDFDVTREVNPDAIRIRIGNLQADLDRESAQLHIFSSVPDWHGDPVFGARFAFLFENSSSYGPIHSIEEADYTLNNYIPLPEFRTSYEKLLKVILPLIRRVVSNFRSQIQNGSVQIYGRLGSPVAALQTLSADQWSFYRYERGDEEDDGIPTEPRATSKFGETIFAPVVSLVRPHQVATAPAANFERLVERLAQILAGPSDSIPALRVQEGDGLAAQLKTEFGASQKRFEEAVSIACKRSGLSGWPAKRGRKALR